MSGICGVLSLKTVVGSCSQFAHTHCARLVNELLCMGRDGSADWSAPEISLAHIQLRETPEAAFEVQPIISDDERFVMVFDGRIDNRDALFEAIGEVSVDNRNRCCDGELVLRVFLMFRDATPTMLLGDFAFAVWDKIESRLFLTRDHVGGRLLYFVQTEDLFAFASRDEALLLLPGVSCEPNIELIIHAFAPPLPKPSRSLRGWYRDVMRFPFGYFGHVTAQRPDIQFAWYEPWSEPPVPSPQKFDDAVRQVSTLLAQAAAARMRSCNTPALFMSGGIDSASVISAMRKVRPKTEHAVASRIVSLSVVDAGNEDCIETKSILELQKHFATDPVFVDTKDAGGDEMRSFLSGAIFDHPHPQDNSNVTLMPLFRRAQLLGLTSVLTGAGGDIVADCTDGALARVWQQSGIRATWRMAKAFCRNNMYCRGVHPVRLLQQALRQRLAALLPTGIKQRLRWVVRRRAFERNPFVSRRLILQEFKRAAVSNLTACDLPRTAVDTVFRSVQQRRASLRAVGEGQDMLQHAASRFGVVASDLWSDLRLIQYFACLAPRVACCGGWTKSPVREVLVRGGVHARVAFRLGKEHIGGDLLYAMLPLIREKCPFELLTSERSIGVKLNSLRVFLFADKSSTPHSGDLVDASTALALYLWGVGAFRQYAERIMAAKNTSNFANITRLSGKNGVKYRKGNENA